MEQIEELEEEEVVGKQLINIYCCCFFEMQSPCINVTILLMLYPVCSVSDLNCT